MDLSKAKYHASILKDLGQREAANAIKSLMNQVSEQEKELEKYRRVIKQSVQWNVSAADLMKYEEKRNEAKR